MTKPARLLLVAVAVFGLILAVTEPVLAGADTFAARLRAFEEVPAISSPGQGLLFANLNAAENSIDYTLIYFSLQGTVTQAHIHIGQTSVNGGIVLFFCTNLTPPAGVPTPPPCPTTPGVNAVAGTLTSANVITQAAQGIAAGDFSEIVDALRAGVGYANVHSDQFPAGEIRGQITH